MLWTSLCGHSNHSPDEYQPLDEWSIVCEYSSNKTLKRFSFSFLQKYTWGCTATSTPVEAEKRLIGDAELSSQFCIDHRMVFKTRSSSVVDVFCNLHATSLSLFERHGYEETETTSKQKYTTIVCIEKQQKSLIGGLIIPLQGNNNSRV